MKKVLICLFVILLSLFLLSCKKKEALEKEEEQSYDYTSLKDEDFIVSNFTLEEIPFVFMERVERLSSYTKELKGETVAKKVIKYTQEIESTFSKDEMHIVTISNSFLVKDYHEAYFGGDLVRYREDSSSEFIESRMDEYLNIFGTLPYGYSIEGFVLSKESILSIEMKEINTYHLVLDNVIGTNNVKIQMKKHGGLNDYPSFTLIEIDLVIEDDFSPVKIILHLEYDVNMNVLGKVSCVQDCVITYTLN